MYENEEKQEQLDIEAPEYADNTPKKNRPINKRIMGLLIIVSSLIIYFIFSSGDKAEEERKAIEGKPNYTSALPAASGLIEAQQQESINMQNMLNSNDRETPIPEEITGTPTYLPAEQMQIYDGTPPGNDSMKAAQADAVNDQALQEKLAFEKQWIEYQKSVFVSKPDVQGQWESKADEHKTSEGKTTQTEPAAQNAYSGLLQTALNTKNGKAEEAPFNPKENFFNTPSSTGYLAATRQASLSPYLIPSGSMIPCTLISGINSDLPGNLAAMVTENVFDWSKPNICLIPQGTKIFGVYDSNIDFAQKRIQVKWSRLIYPDGSTLDIGGMSGVNKQGYSGLKDKFYGHYSRMLTAAVLTTAFGVIPELISNNNSSNGTYITTGGQSVYIPQEDDNARTAGEAVGRAIGDLGNKFFDKALNVKPTLLIRPGMRFNIMVNKDIPFYNTWRGAM